MNGPSSNRPGFSTGNAATPQEMDRRAHESLEAALRELGAARESLKARLNPLWWIRHHPKQALLFGGGAFGLCRLLRMGRKPSVKNDREEKLPSGGLGKYMLLKAAQAAGKALPGAIAMALARRGLARGKRGRNPGGQGD